MSQHLNVPQATQQVFDVLYSDLDSDEEQDEMQIEISMTPVKATKLANLIKLFSHADAVDLDMLLPNGFRWIDFHAFAFIDIKSIETHLVPRVHEELGTILKTLGLSQWFCDFILLNTVCHQCAMRPEEIEHLCVGDVPKVSIKYN
jgi:hypothetical protein